MGGDLFEGGDVLLAEGEPFDVTPNAGSSYCRDEAIAAIENEGRPSGCVVANSSDVVCLADGKGASINGYIGEAFSEYWRKRSREDC